MLAEEFQKALQELLPQNTATLVVAVSGGADSLALCLLAKNYATHNNLVLHAVTVDHNLRSESANEVLYVHDILSNLNIPHTTLVWQHDGKIKRLHENARQARYQLLTNYCKQLTNPVLLTAHHAYDQAETVMMRLLKGSGIRGLTGIAPLSVMNDTFILRPLLHERPDQLKDYLIEQNIKWIEDPSNTNPRFERNRIRNLLDHIKKAGFAIEGINKSANNLKRSANAINELLNQHEQNFLLTTDSLSHPSSRGDEGDAVIHKSHGLPRYARNDTEVIRIDQKKFFNVPDFVQAEWLRNTIFKLGNSNYPKPESTIKAVLEILKAPKVNGYKICGCNIEVTKKVITITGNIRSID